VASETLFSVLGNAVLVGWVCVLAALWLGAANRPGRFLLSLGGLAIPSGFATLPIWNRAANPGRPAGDLYSLAGIEARFSDADVLFLLYFEALAFSLFVAGLIVRDSSAVGAPRIATFPALTVMFFKGPIGALLYAGVRVLTLKRRSLKNSVDKAL